MFTKNIRNATIQYGSLFYPSNFIISKIRYLKGYYHHEYRHTPDSACF